MAHNDIHIPLSDLVAWKTKAQSLIKQHRRRTSPARAVGSASRRRGRGLDFSHLRAYQAGDEVRHMDWKVTARRGPHVRQFHEDQHYPQVIVLDLRAGMYFGTRTRFKSSLVIHLATLLLWVHHLQNDPVVLQIIHDDGMTVHRLSGKPSTFLNTLHLLSEYSAPTASDTPHQNTWDPKELQRPSTPAHWHWISDFSWMSSEHESLLAQIAQRHTLSFYHLYDPLECRLPQSTTPCLLPFSDGTQHTVLDIASARLQETHHARFERLRSKLDHWCQTHRTTLHRYATPTPFSELEISW